MKILFKNDEFIMQQKRKNWNNENLKIVNV